MLRRILKNSQSVEKYLRDPKHPFVLRNTFSIFIFGNIKETNRFPFGENKFSRKKPNKNRIGRTLWSLKAWYIKKGLPIS